MFQLRGEPPGGFALEDHFLVGGREVPHRIAGGHVLAGEIFELMAVGALSGRRDLCRRAALYVHDVAVTVVALERRVAGGVTVHAVRVHQDGVGGEEGGFGFGFGLGFGFGRGVRQDPGRRWRCPGVCAGRILDAR